MTKHHLDTYKTWALAIALALVIGAACNLDGPSDVEAATAVAQDLDDAVKHAAAAKTTVGDEL